MFQIPSSVLIQIFSHSLNKFSLLSRKRKTFALEEILENFIMHVSVIYIR